MLPLDDTRTLKYNTLISVHTAHLLQKDNTYHYVFSTLDGSPLPGRGPRRGPVPKLLWADLLSFVVRCYICITFLWRTRAAVPLRVSHPVTGVFRIFV